MGPRARNGPRWNPTRFGISAIEHHVTITSVPAACRGPTGAQINFAVGTALHAVAGTVHGKARIRARALKLSPLLAQLVTAVPASAARARWRRHRRPARLALPGGL